MTDSLSIWQAARFRESRVAHGGTGHGAAASRSECCGASAGNADSTVNHIVTSPGIGAQPGSRTPTATPSPCSSPSEPPAGRRRPGRQAAAGPWRSRPAARPEPTASCQRSGSWRAGADRRQHRSTGSVTAEPGRAAPRPARRSAARRAVIKGSPHYWRSRPGASSRRPRPYFYA